MTNFNSLNVTNSTFNYSQSTEEFNLLKQNINFYKSSFAKVFSNNFQTTHMKSCSKWVSYFSEYNEIWGYFLFFYGVSLLFFFFYIIPESFSKYRVKTNPATAKGWVANVISCGVPFFVLFSIMFESMYMLFLNEVFLKKASALFTIEGRQWKWEYRFSTLCFVEYLASYKNVGDNKKVTLYKFWNEANSQLREHMYILLGKDGFDDSTKIKADLLKSKKSYLNKYDFFLLNDLTSNKNYSGFSSKKFVFNFFDDFSMFRLNENMRKSVSTTKVLTLPNFDVIRCFITGCDVIHSWTIPNMGLRVDAVPGKLYNIKIMFKHYGVFVGQCSEVCGLRHAYMPIVVNFVHYKIFLKYTYVLIFLSFDQINYNFLKKSSLSV